MSEPTLPPSLVFDDPGAVLPPADGSNPDSINAATPVALGGIGQTWATTPAGAGQTNQVVVTGENTRLNLGTGAGDVNTFGAGGVIIESVQLVDSQGNPIQDFSKTITVGGIEGYNGTSISLAETVSGDSTSQQQSILDSAGSQLPTTGIPTGGFAYYVHGGTGNDVIRGSSFNDFLRGGGGNDFINAGDGQDLVRGGTGDDTIFLGQGFDTLYYTPDQVGSNDLDIVQDFTSGEDKLNVAIGIKATISADGKSILFTNEATGGVTTLFSEKDQFKQSDLNFLA